MTYTKADYRRERALCDAEHRWTDECLAENGYIGTAQIATKPKRLRKVDNAMRGRVEQFEILRDLPEKFTAYLESDKPDGQGARLAVTCWPGDVLGQAWVHTVGKRRSQFGERQRYGRARIGGKLYAWQGPGAGMYAHFRAIKESV